MARFWAIACIGLFATAAFADEPVKIEVQIPAPDAKVVNTYAVYSQLSMIGRLNVQGRHKIKVRLYLVEQEDLPWKKLMGFSTFTDAEGNFAVEMEAPPEGWPVGNLRAEIRPEFWGFAKSYGNFRTVNRKNKVFVNPGYLPKNEVIAEFNIADPPAVPTKIRPKEGVIVRGTYNVAEVNADFPNEEMLSVFRGDGRHLGGVLALRQPNEPRYSFEIHQGETDPGVHTHQVFRGFEANLERGLGEFRLEVIEPEPGQ